MKPRQALKIAGQLEAARARAKKLCGDDYAAGIEHFRTIIGLQMQRQNVGILDAAMSVVAGLQQSKPKTSGATQTMLLATAAEMLEEKAKDLPIGEEAK